MFRPLSMDDFKLSGCLSNYFYILMLLHQLFFCPCFCEMLQFNTSTLFKINTSVFIAILGQQNWFWYSTYGRPQGEVDQLGYLTFLGFKICSFGGLFQISVIFDVLWLLRIKSLQETTKNIYDKSKPWKDPKSTIFEIQKMQGPPFPPPLPGQPCTNFQFNFNNSSFIFLVPPPYAPPMPPSVASSTTEISWRGSSKMSITRKPARV